MIDSQLRTLPDSVLVSELCEKLDPLHLVAFSSVSCEFKALCARRRNALAFSRHRARVQLRSVRLAIACREAYTQQATGVPELLPAADCLAAIQQLMQRSPECVRDLGGAVHRAVKNLSSQAVLAPTHAQRIRADLLNIITFVCLLAWKQALRNLRAVVAAEQDEEAEEDRVAVVAVAVGPAANQQQQQQRQQQQSAGAGDAQSMGPSDSSAAQAAAAAGASSSTSAGPSVASTLPSSRCSDSGSGSRHSALDVAASAAGDATSGSGVAAAAATPAATAAVPAAPVMATSRGMQTDGPTNEVAECVDGFAALVTCPNRSMRPCGATLNLLLHFLRQELQAWQAPAAAAPAAHGAAGALALELPPGDVMEGL